MTSDRSKHKRDYRRALKEIEAVMDATRGTPEGHRLDVLVALVEAWEAKTIRSAFPPPLCGDCDGNDPYRD